MSEFLFPKSGSIRPPTSNSKQNGQVVNPPRMNEFGGLDKTKEKHGHFKNDKTIRKVGRNK